MMDKTRLDKDFCKNIGVCGRVKFRKDIASNKGSKTK